MTYTDKQPKKNFDWLKEYQWQKGQSGNPKGRPKVKTLKEFARDFLASMSEEGRLQFLRQVDADVVWKMAEGMPPQQTDITTKGDKIENINVTNEIVAAAKAELKKRKLHE